MRPGKGSARGSKVQRYKVHWWAKDTVGHNKTLRDGTTQHYQAAIFPNYLAEYSHALIAKSKVE